MPAIALQVFFLILLYMNASLSPKFRFGAKAKAADVSFSSPQATVGGNQAPLTNAE